MRVALRSACFAVWAKKVITRLGLLPAVTAYRETKLPYLQQRDSRDMRNVALLMRY
jgi:hypothetical protein